MVFECPWPKGSHKEDHFPCGVLYLDVDSDEHTHFHVPGHVLKWYIRYGKSVFRGFRMPRSGKELRKLLEDLVSNGWFRAHHRVLLRACLDCPRADWDDFLLRLIKEL